MGIKRGKSKVGWSKKSLYEKFKHIDMFGESISFTVDGDEEFKTLLGAILSAVLIVLFVVYLVIQLNVMLDYRDTKHQTTINENNLDVNREFTGEQLGLNWVFVAEASIDGGGNDDEDKENDEDDEEDEEV